MHGKLGNLKSGAVDCMVRMVIRDHIWWTAITPCAATSQWEVIHITPRIGPAAGNCGLILDCACCRILSEDKAMVETLRPELLPREISVKADLPQIAYRWAVLHVVLLIALPGCDSDQTSLSQPCRQNGNDGKLVGIHQKGPA